MRLALVFFLTASSLSRAAADTLFHDDFEEGHLDKWDVVTGYWDVVDVGGNHVARLSEAVYFGVMNIRGFADLHFTMEASIWQRTRDHGANLYFYNNSIEQNVGFDSGLWFGFSGYQNAIGWGDMVGGEQTLLQFVNSDVELDYWVRLKLVVSAKGVQMWSRREGVDDDFVLLFGLEGTVSTEGNTRLGLLVGGLEAWVDDVIVYDHTGPTAVAGSTWGEVKARRPSGTE